MTLLLGAALAALCPPIASLPSDAQPTALQAAAAAGKAPMAFYVAGAGTPSAFGAAAGPADPKQRPMTTDTPLRIASNTKTFVAATILRLHEQGRIDLDAPIAPLLDPALVRILEADGYRTGTITVRQLMSHSAGLYDQGSDPRFIKRVLADPDHRWTRAELVGLTTDYADPQSAPGTEFLYSDAGYILLGDIVERLTGKPLAAAVREQLGLDRLGLGATWWEIAEAAPAGAPARAHQYIDGVDATAVHPSFDLFGGGGLLMSARDLALFTAALFEGRVFDRPETLATMLEPGPHRGAEGYRLGMIVRQADGREIYFHTGFWGTAAYYDPRTRRAVAGVTTEQKAFRAKVTPIIESLLGIETAACDKPAAE